MTSFKHDEIDTGNDFFKLNIENKFLEYFNSGEENHLSNYLSIIANLFSYNWK